MKRLVMACAAAAAAFGATGAGLAADAPPTPAETSIPFVNHHGIYDWDAIDRRTLYIQDIHRRWFRATTFSDCIDLDFANQIGFEAGPTDTLDRFSAIIVRGQRCPLLSLVASGPPPKRGKKHEAAGS